MDRSAMSVQAEVRCGFSSRDSQVASWNAVSAAEIGYLGGKAESSLNSVSIKSLSQQ
jgi:hypothetical protein